MKELFNFKLFNREEKIMPSEMVKSEVNAMRELSDDEIAYMYMKQSITTFPSMVIKNALGIIMRERKFTVNIASQYEIVRE